MSSSSNVPPLEGQGELIVYDVCTEYKIIILLVINELLWNGFARFSQLFSNHKQDWIQLKQNIESLFDTNELKNTFQRPCNGRESVGEQLTILTKCSDSHFLFPCLSFSFLLCLLLSPLPGLVRFAKCWYISDINRSGKLPGEWLGEKDPLSPPIESSVSSSHLRFEELELLRKFELENAKKFMFSSTTKWVFPIKLKFTGTKSLSEKSNSPTQSNTSARPFGSRKFMVWPSCDSVIHKNGDFKTL